MISEGKRKFQSIRKNLKCPHCSNNGYTFNIDDNFILNCSTCCNHLQKEISALKDTNCNNFNSWNINTKSLKLKSIDFETIAQKFKSIYFKSAFKKFYFEKLPLLRKN